MTEPPRTRILVVDDEPSLRHLLTITLRAHGYDILEAPTGSEGVKAVRDLRPDMLVLDLGLPDMDGVEVVRRVREWNDVPILILSIRNREEEKIEALDAGADDYLTKPFGPGELTARIRATFRRARKPEGTDLFISGSLDVDFSRRLVRFNGAAVQLTPTEYDLMELLVRRAGRVVTHRQAIAAIWGGGGHEDALHLLRVNVSNLRKKLEPEAARPRYIVTEPGVGYRFREQRDGEDTGIANG